MAKLQCQENWRGISCFVLGWTRTHCTTFGKSEGWRSLLDDDANFPPRKLADTTNSGQLYFPEFCLAMYLCNLKLTGRSLPSTLPDNIKNEVSSMVDSIIFLSTPEEPGSLLAAPTPTPLGFIKRQSFLETQPTTPPRSSRPISDDIRLSQGSLATVAALSAFRKNQQILDESVGNKERETEHPQTWRVSGYDPDREKLRSWDEMQNMADVERQRYQKPKVERDSYLSQGSVGPVYTDWDAARQRSYRQVFADSEAERQRYQRAAKERASQADVHAQQRNEMEAQQKELFLNAGPQRGPRTKKDDEKEAQEQRLREAQEIERRQRELFRNSGPQKGDRKARVTPEEAAEKIRLRAALEEEERQQALLRNSDPEKAQAQRQQEAQEIERRQRELFLNSGPQKKKKRSQKPQPAAPSINIVSQNRNKPESMGWAAGIWDGVTRWMPKPQPPRYQSGK